MVLGRARAAAQENQRPQLTGGVCTSKGSRRNNTERWRAHRYAASSEALTVNEPAAVAGNAGAGYPQVKLCEVLHNLHDVQHVQR